MQSSGAPRAKSCGQGGKKEKCWEFGTARNSGGLGNSPAIASTLVGVTPSPPRSERQSWIGTRTSLNELLVKKMLSGSAMTAALKRRSWTGGSTPPRRTWSLIALV